MNTVIRAIDLYYTYGSSDKEYRVRVEETPSGGFVVNAYSGRRNGTMVLQPKTSTPVSRGAANEIFNTLVKKKAKDGYTTDLSGEPGAGANEYAFGATHLPVAIAAVPAGAVSGMAVQLLNPINEGDLESKFTDPIWVAQEKFDGERRPVKCTGGEVEGGNRNGLQVTLPKNISDSIAALGRNIEVDAEVIGEQLYIFDVTYAYGNDLRTSPYSERLKAMDAIGGALEGLFATGAVNGVCTIPTAYTEQQKRELFERVKRDGGEGVVFKRLDALYVPGKSHNDQVKFKFYEECTVVVDAINQGVRSVSMRMLDGDDWINVGNVTILSNQEIPEVGAVIEVKYLYAYNGGSLFQPLLLKSRNDIAPEECVVGQLKYKPQPKQGFKP